MRPVEILYVGGPTALVAWGGLRLLTDPTFDPAGTAYETPVYALRKTAGPALSADALGPVDVVLLSHDHHFDNLDASGRAFLARAGQVLTTEAGAERLGGHARGLAPWQVVELTAPDGGAVRVTATPARHGPAHLDRGPVVGFLLTRADAPGRDIYLSGDTVWYDGVAEVSRRFAVATAVLFMGAARVAAVGPWHLTFTAEEGVDAARAFADAAIVPVHFEDWEHFSESRPEIDAAFARAGLGQRLRWLPRGVASTGGA
jgi:L-ascorbate metabolism protein UlaG (beta-lactamase superfamily)